MVTFRLLGVPNDVKSIIGFGSLQIELEIDKRDEPGWLEQVFHSEIKEGTEVFQDRIYMPVFLLYVCSYYLAFILPFFIASFLRTLSYHSSLRFIPSMHCVSFLYIVLKILN